METEHYRQVRELFDAVVVLDAAARENHLRAHAADARVIAEVEALLAAGARHDTEQMARPLRSALTDVASDVQIGDRLGVWRVQNKIAEGGMGAVFQVARDDGHFQQTAALKFIKGSPRPDSLAYFTRERQLLASLAHPQIARLLDGGATAQGRPYLVMEYIDGVPIDVFCRERHLHSKAVLALFVDACHAVAFAHRQLVVHCDLKPSNLLVTPDARPILLDFGIAQLIDRVAGDDAVAVDAETAQAIAYTPRYASPEQRRGERVTTASDIFSLGTVLRELLAQAADASGKQRELQALIDKATDADARLRYTSVDALCADIESYLNRRPLLAMPMTPTYRLRKFAMRRWPWLLAALGFVLTIAAFTTKVMIESQRAHAAEQAALVERDRAIRAEIEARASEASALKVSEFLTSVFDGANPDAETGNVPTAVLLDQALHRVETDLADQPATQAQMYAALGAVQYTIEQAERGRESFARAIAIERTQNRPLVLAQMLNDSAMWKLGHFDGADAVPEAREALQLVEQHTDADSTFRLDVLNAAASVVGNGESRAEATALFERAIAIARRIDPDSERLSDVLGAAGWNQRAIGNYDAAIALIREGAELDIRHGNKLDDDYLSGLETLAGTLSLARRFDESEQIFKRVIATRREAGRLETKYGAWSLAEYARMLGKAGRPREALPIFEQVFAIGDRKMAEDGPALAVWRNNYATIAERAGDFASADQNYRTAMALAEGLWGEDAPFVAGIVLNHARNLPQVGRMAEAGAAFERCLEIYRAAAVPDSASALLTTRVEYARWLLASHRANAAAAELALARPHRAAMTAELAARLEHSDALLLAERGDVAAALTALQKAEAATLAALGAEDPQSWLVQIDRAELLKRNGRSDEAAALAAEILGHVGAKLVPASPLLDRIRQLR